MQYFLNGAILLAALFGIYLTSFHGYLLFHSLAEVFSIVIACGIFMIAWNARRLLQNHYLLFIGIAYLYVGGIDLLHTLAYKGMGVFEGFGANLPTQLWIAARYLEAASLLFATFFLYRKLSPLRTLLAYGLATGLLLTSIFYWKVFPDCFSESVGLTPFKIHSEYVICLILLAAMGLLIKNSKAFDRDVLILLIASIAAAIARELSFTAYLSVYGPSNMIGHLLKIVVFYLMYKAIIEIGLVSPHKLLFRDLKQSEAKFRGIFETNVVPIAYCDMDGRVIDANDDFLNLLGFTRGELEKGDARWDVVTPPEWKHMDEAGLQYLRRDGVCPPLEKEYLRRDGTRVPVLVGARLIPESSEQVVAFAVDLTERKRMEEALRESEAQFKLLSNTAAQLLATEDPLGIVKELSNEVMVHLDCQAFFNFVVDEQSERLHLNACSGIPDEEVRKIEWLDYEMVPGNPAGPDAVSMAADDICRVPDPLSELLKSCGIRSYASHPLKAAGRVLGNLSFGTTTRTQFCPRDLAIMKTVADQVAIAMERVRLVGELQESHAKLETRVLERTARLAQANRSLAFEIAERTSTQKSLEEKNALLRESEARLRQIIDALPVHVYAKDRKGRFILANRMTAEAFGCLPSEVEGRTYADLVPEIPESAAYLRDDREVIESGSPKFISEETLTLGPGRVQILQTTKVPFVQTGAGSAVLSVSVDITELREVESALRRSEERLRRNNELLQKVFDGITDPLILLDSECLLMMINKAAMDYYGVREGMDVFGKPCFQGLRGRDAVCPECELPLLSAGNQTVSFERNGLTNSSRVENVTVYPVLDEQGRRDAVIVRISDVTQAKILERQILQNEKLASLGLVTSGIAHEINNPNSFIHFNLPILKKYLEEVLPIVDEHAALHPELEVLHMSYGEFREDIFKLIENMEHGSQRINKIVGVLKSFVRKRDSEGMQVVDLKQLVDKVVALCHTELRHKLSSFEILVPDDLPCIVSNPEALEQVLFNLLINAIHACDKPDSHVSLRVEKAPSGMDGFIIEVADNGSGMDESIRERIFDPFFTTKSSTMGTGLGLYICHNHVTSLSGRIEVESSVGQGTTFRVVLPQSGKA